MDSRKKIRYIQCFTAVCPKHNDCRGQKGKEKGMNNIGDDELMSLVSLWRFS